MPAKGTSPRERWNPLLKSYPDSDKVNSVSFGAETMFTRLIAKADDYGNYWASPRRLLAGLFSVRWELRDVDETYMVRWRNELVTTTYGPLIALYEVDGVSYLHLINPRRRLRADITPEELVPREPANIDQKAIAAHVPKTYRERTGHVPLDLDLDLDQDLKENTLLERVLKRLNELREENWDWTRYSPITDKYEKNTEQITARLAEDYTVDDLIVILEHKAAEEAGKESGRRYFNAITPFRAKWIENNLTLAKDWDAKGRPGKNGRKMGTERGADAY